MRVLPALAALALAGCASSAPPPRAPLPPISEPAIRSIIADLAAIRGLPERAPIGISLLDEPAFLSALRQRIAGAPEPGEAERENGFLTAWSLFPDPRGGARAPSTAEEVLEEQIAAFYDIEARRIYVRAAPPRSEDEAREQRGVLAHEIEHALQAQSFAIGDLSALPEDSRLAHLAVLEGDAMVAMAAYLASENGAPLGRVLRRISDLSRTLPIEEIARGEGHAALRHALPIARERLVFPYLGGMGLVADLYRAGGFPLVNQLFTRPPASTEQVLHPEKYIAGEPPITIRAPPVPPGYRVLASEPLGELQARVVLERCVTPAEARAASEGWGGDRFTVLADPAQRVALLWSTAWDTEQDAMQIEAALRRNPRCWEGPFVAQRDAHKVAFVRGLPEPLATAAAARLLELPEPAPPAAPIGPYEIPPRRPMPAPYRGVVQADTYRSDWLGVAASIPAGVPATTRHKDLELKVGRDDMLVTGALVLSDRVTSPRFVERLFQEVASGFASALKIEGLVATGGGPSTHPLGPAIERSWVIAGTTVSLRAVMVPVCGGSGSFVFVQTWADPYAKTVLDGWLYSFRWIAEEKPPVCEALDPR